MEIIKILREVFLQEDQQFISALYMEMLNRPPSKEEANDYLNQFSSGASKLDVLAAIISSKEARILYDKPLTSSGKDQRKTAANKMRKIFKYEQTRLIKELYRELLCREADQNGLQNHLYFLNKMKRNGTVFKLFMNILMSEEALNNLLLSSPDKDEAPKAVFGDFKSFPIKKHDQKNPLSHYVLNKKTSIIILTWNGIEHTKKCLESLRKTIRHQLVEVVVFDNGSTDGTVEYLQSLNWIKAVYNNKNIGFTAGNNEALKYCDPNNDIVLLNNDMILEQEDWMDLLQETAYSDPRIGVTGARLCGADGDLEGKLLHAGSYIYPDDLAGQQIGGVETDVNQYSAIRDVQGIVFACAYIKRDTIDQIGFLDTDYFAYFEDTDYCLRAISNGLRVVLDGRVTLKHIHNGATKTNKVSFWNIYKPSQKIFERKWKNYLQSQYQQSVNWHSTVNLPFFGYANSSRNIMLALDEQNVEVRYRFVYGKGTPILLEESSKIDDHRLNLFSRRARDPHAPDVIYGQGDVFFRNKGRYNVGYTMLEVDGLPAEWVRQSNMMNEIWVPSQFNAETFRESGVNVPIHVVPLGIDPNYFNPGIQGTRFSDKFTFLSVFEWGERKAPEDLFRTFLTEFAANDDVLLVCKITNNDPSVNVEHEIQKLGFKDFGSKVLILLNQKLPTHLMGSLYRSADCFVLSTKGEGWGMPILEAMACGIPTVATDWSAQQEFLNIHTGYPVNVKKLVPAIARCPYYKGFKWAEPDLEHLAFQLRHVYENRETAKEKSHHAANKIIESWTWKNTALKIKQRLDEIGS
ncbi:glycosyltransferase [Metabacillus sp. 113a]|uniref:glycosyltransferase n=1 Tax=Metabacillus sp. 113a TaxID=3404706 RepID=UPI003CFB8C31